MITFSKYHGCGNSFVIITEEQAKGKDYSKLAEEMCSESLGIGADGLIIVKSTPDLEMIFYNRDGSRAPMCGNGIRCFARYCYDEGICKDNSFPVETLAGTMVVDIKSKEPFLVEINMGKPNFEPGSCDIITDSQEPFLNKELIMADDSKETVSTFFMGTVHTVMWVEDFHKIDYENIGKQICHHQVYKNQTNVNMVKVIDNHTLELKTYERGVGMTFACGTGACASVVWGIKEGKCEKETDVILPYGALHITQKENKEILMKGPATFVAKGTYTEE